MTKLFASLKSQMARLKRSDLTEFAAGVGILLVLGVALSFGLALEGTQTA